MSLQISPSLLLADHAALGEEVLRCERWGIDALHLDIMDYSYAGDQGFTWRTVQAVINYTSLPVELHLMVRDPLLYFDKLAALSPAIMTFQLEASPDSLQCVELAHQAGIQAGLAIEPGTPVSYLYDRLGSCSSATLMGVVPGKAGSLFDRSILQKITQLYELRKDIVIRLDGGVDEATAIAAFRLGCSQVIIGTALFQAANPAEMIKRIKNECEVK